MAKFKNKEDYEKWKSERGKPPLYADTKPVVKQESKPKISEAKALIILIGFVAAFILFLGSQHTDSSSTPTAVREYEAHGDIEACVFSQMMVSKLLKAPATADFGPCNSTKSGTGYKIASYVDSQNSFCANIRTPYAWDGRWYNKEWQTQFLALGDKTYVADSKIVDADGK